MTDVTGDVSGVSMAGNIRPLAKGGEWKFMVELSDCGGGDERLAIWMAST